MIVIAVFLLIMNQTEFCWVQNQKKKQSLRSLSFQLERSQKDFVHDNSTTNYNGKYFDFIHEYIRVI